MCRNHTKSIGAQQNFHLLNYMSRKFMYVLIPTPKKSNNVDCILKHINVTEHAFSFMSKVCRFHIKTDKVLCTELDNISCIVY